MHLLNEDDDLERMARALKHATKGLTWFYNNWGSPVAKNYLDELSQILEDVKGK